MIFAAAACICCACAWYLFDGARRGAIVVAGQRYYVLGDDAMISLRYAYNLTHGYGLVWNPGERVEGITNLGWTLVMALPLWFGAALPIAPLIVKGINAVLQAALAWGLFAWSWRRRRSLQGVIAAGLVALDGSVTVWGMNGFETTLQALLITAALVPLLDDRGTGWAPLWAALAVIVRPDALLIFAVVFAVAVARVWAAGWTRAGAIAIPGSLGLLALLFIGQRLYYGDWLPNTYALKATGGAAGLDRGLAYLGRFAWSESFALPLLSAPALVVTWRLAVEGRVAWRLAAVAATPYLWALYVVLVGGDAFPYGRFFILMVPLLALFAGALLEDAVRSLQRGALPRRRATIAFGGALLVVGLGAHVARSLPMVRAASEPLYEAFSGVCLAVALDNAALPTSTVVGVYYAGVTPYFLPLHQFHDFLGKSDRRIARSRAHVGPPGHNKWDYAYSLGQIRPDLIITAAPFTDADDAHYRAIAQGSEHGFHPTLWLDPRFQDHYRPNRLLPSAGSTPTKWPPNWIYAGAGFDPGPIVLPNGVCKTGPW